MEPPAYVAYRAGNVFSLRGRKMTLDESGQSAFAFRKMGAAILLAGACETEDLVCGLPLCQGQNFPCCRDRPLQIPDDGQVPAIVDNPEDRAVRRIRP